MRQGPDGGWYLDARWNAAGLVAEIDGAHHQGGANPIADALRQNAVALHGDRVLRIPDIGLRKATLMPSSTRSKQPSSTQGLWRFVFHEARTYTTPGVA